eukprot:TRINITY_DN3335_c0_g1_i1.p1 TRINITY_DN3335_c0_g1~~TRINITY_DN3335_c0_g1_i1.p1  ORF type:complete len:552 (+),score=145.91 TRINITY_DN3335_c0_g1_i1:85-1656(+)
MATGQVLFHRFYCKKSFARFNVKRVAASCVWLAAKLEESPKRIRDVLNVFFRVEQRRQRAEEAAARGEGEEAMDDDSPLDLLDPLSKTHEEMKVDLIRTERHLLKEMGFVCHVEHPHKFLFNYMTHLDVQDQEVQQEAWNFANDSLRTTLCVRLRSEVVACGVIYAATRRARLLLPENPPWWQAFDAEKKDIDTVCGALAELYRQPAAKYHEVSKDSRSFVLSTRAWEPSPRLQELAASATGSTKPAPPSAASNGPATGPTSSTAAIMARLDASAPSDAPLPPPRVPTPPLPAPASVPPAGPPTGPSIPETADEIRRNRATRPSGSRPSERAGGESGEETNGAVPPVATQEGATEAAEGDRGDARREGSKKIGKDTITPPSGSKEKERRSSKGLEKEGGREREAKEKGGTSGPSSTVASAGEERGGGAKERSVPVSRERDRERDHRDRERDRDRDRERERERERDRERHRERDRERARAQERDHERPRKERAPGGGEDALAQRGGSNGARGSRGAADRRGGRR